VQLHIERHGAGRPFLWAHGLTSSIAAQRDTGLFQWAQVPGLDLVEYDAVGHGRSDAFHDDDAYVWPKLAGDFLAVADHVGFESFVAGGASMGCATAIYAALDRPDRVQALVLAIPPTAWETRADQGDTYRKSAAFVEQRGLEALIEANRNLPVAPAWQAELREARLARLATMDAQALPFIFRGAGRSDLPHRDQVATIAAPTIILAWADDPGHPLSTAEELDRLIGTSELHVATSLDDVRAWPQAVERFLHDMTS
jgi:pimeloyl-ACP methyl ester carboxylesterase